MEHFIDNAVVANAVSMFRPVAVGFCRHATQRSIDEQAKAIRAYASTRRLKLAGIVSQLGGPSEINDESTAALMAYTSSQKRLVLLIANGARLTRMGAPHAFEITSRLSKAGLTVLCISDSFSFDRTSAITRIRS